jgi:pyruvate dehydrogenase E2 component (dihydrolipoamide acetyltransferase)
VVVITPVVMPQMGLEVTEGIVATIHVARGTRVAEGDLLLELETDKALTDVVAPRGGLVQSIEVEVGDTVELGATLVVLADEEGEEVVATAEAAADDGLAASSPEPEPAPPPPGERLRAAPVARRAAERLGVALAEVTGTGPRGRITLKDVESAAAAPSGNGAAPPALEPLNGTRRAVARHMTQSQQIPQFPLTREIDATWLLAEKDRLSGTARVSVNDMLVQALAETVLRHRGLAASFVEGDPPQLERREGVDVGLAVATDRGLLVPVLRRAHERSLGELAAERVRLVDAARAGRLSLDEMSGATITISNLGGFGIDSFTAMLNPGESAILAVGRPLERVVPRDRSLTVVTTISLSLTIDHRVMDGASGARALVELADLLEGAMTWRT